MRYDFKPLQELYWGVLIAASLVLLQALLVLQPEQINDWQVWAVALLGGMTRAGAGAAIDYIRRSVSGDTKISDLESELRKLTPEERDELFKELTDSD